MKDEVGKIQAVPPEIPQAELRPVIVSEIVTNACSASADDVRHYPVLGGHGLLPQAGNMTIMSPRELEEILTRYCFMLPSD